jgi:hypothetical protein
MPNQLSGGIGMESYLENSYTFLSMFSVLPTIVGIFLFSKIFKPFLSLVINQVLNNVLMLISNFGFFNIYSAINSKYFYYSSFLITLICYTIFFVLLLPKFKKLFIPVAILILSFVAIELVHTGMKEMNLLPFLFIDFLVIFCSVLCLNARLKVTKELSNFLIISIVYFIYDCVFNVVSTYYFRYLNEQVFNALWYGLSPIIGMFWYLFLAFTFYKSAKSKSPEFSKISDFD